MPSSRVDYFFGELAGHPVGTTYRDRLDVMRSGLHDNWMPGISGNGATGANCIVLNKGYVDDEDHGDWIRYTGAGGNDSSSRRQVADQSIQHRHNAALVFSEVNGLPVRVVRGPRGEAPYAPSSGYRYDGLYKVIEHWPETGRDGYLIWRFHLVRLDFDEALPWTPKEQRQPAQTNAPVPSPAGPGASPNPPLLPPVGNREPGRAIGVVQRVVRSTRVSQHIKELYDHRCQICGMRVDLPVGLYSEGAHIRPVGSPHDGPDTPDNMLCLCPNHHVVFDRGGLFLDANLDVRDHRGQALGRLLVDPLHTIDERHAAYHREHHGF